MLRRAASAGDVIRITHQEIAAELGTSREVVSRILEDLHARGALIAGRGLITLADRQKIARLVTLSQTAQKFSGMLCARF